MVQNKKPAEPIALKLFQLMFKTITPIMPNVMGNYAYQIWFTPQRFTAPKQEQIIAQKAKASFITIDNLRIRVWSWGEGPTVFFIHGWGGRGTQVSSFVEVLNNAGFRVMSLDMPAHGQSDGKKTNAFIIAKAINEILQSIDNLHGIITHSFGGAIFGHLYNAQLPLNKIVMFCPPATVKTALDQFCNTLTLPASIETYITTRLKNDFGPDIFNKLSLLENAKKIAIPTMIVHDKDDDVVPFKDGQEVIKILKQGTFLETQELGHRKILFDTNVVKQVSQFIQS
ncbi:MAG: alpha/beta hydrolase [Proteobacteria bacterium]|nr:alpha/beta hydrolase [Pseudomonadota bacterium]